LTGALFALPWCPSSECWASLEVASLAPNAGSGVTEGVVEFDWSADKAENRELWSDEEGDEDLDGGEM